jgi:hypothetical protein
MRADGLGLAVGEAHRRYTNFINGDGPSKAHGYDDVEGQKVAISCK